MLVYFFEKWCKKTNKGVNHVMRKCSAVWGAGDT